MAALLLYTWTAIWVIAALIWGSTIWWMWPSWSSWCAALSMLLLIPLFAVEGMELAAAALVDKHPSSVNSVRSRKALAEVKSNLGAFFSNRQLFVALIIVVVSLGTSFSQLYVPWVGVISIRPIASLFDIGFVTLSVLWIGQVPAKRLAMLDPLAFLAWTWPVWPMVKVVGKLHIADPSEIILRVAKSAFGVGNVSQMPLQDIDVVYDWIDDCWYIRPRPSGSEDGCSTLQNAGRVGIE